MHIGIQKIKQHGGREVAAARIDFDNRKINFPDEMWFSLRGDNNYIYPALSDGFLIGLLPVAMKLGESIRVEGPISTCLSYGLEAYQSILNCWWPDIFNVININYADLVCRRNDIRQAGVGCSFSGGVDSFYAVLKHLPGQQRLNSYQLTHAVMVNRFDQITNFDEEGTSTHIYKNYRPVLENRGIELLMIDTNLRRFRQLVFPGDEIARSFNSPLSACAHILGNLFGRFIISGHTSYAYADLVPSGANPVADHYLGSDQLQIIHHAEGSITRRNKIEFLADIPEIQQHLHVCYENPTFNVETGGILNCCKCVKCIRILITLELLGKIDPFITFPYRHERNYFNNPEVIYKVKDYVLKDLIQLAKKKDNKEWIRILERAIHIKERLKLDEKAPTEKSFIRSAINRITFRG